MLRRVTPAKLEDPVQIGALAKATGVTVRALHHYDAVGLLVPDERSYSGRRPYSRANVERLYRIIALRKLGLSLEQIREVLEREPDLVATVRSQLAPLERNLALQQELHASLTRILAMLDREQHPTLDQLVQATQVMTMIENHYTPEQLTQLERRRQQLGDGAIKQGEREWAELIESVRAERAAGTPPTDPRMLALARRWRSLVEQFTGGDEGIRRSLQDMYREQGPKTASRGMVDPELMEYVGRALRELRDMP
jgi:MerR family transcriptional regulator, thiopeptide resistance regulator